MFSVPAGYRRQHGTKRSMEVGVRGGGAHLRRTAQHGGFYITPPPFSLAKFFFKSKVFI